MIVPYFSEAVADCTGVRASLSVRSVGIAAMTIAWLLQQ